MKFDDFLSYPISFSKPVVVGHWPSSLYSKGFFDCMPYVELNRKIISIDGGCMVKTVGQLNAMIIPDGSKNEYSFEAFDLFPVKTAVDDQAGHLPDIAFCWPDCEVEMLQDGEKTCLVRHLSSGQVLRVFKEDMWETRENFSVTIPRMAACPVRAGEKVSVVYETDEGSLIKKEGKVGWYGGSLHD